MIPELCRLNLLLLQGISDAGGAVIAQVLSHSEMPLPFAAIRVVPREKYSRPLPCQAGVFLSQLEETFLLR